MECQSYCITWNSILPYPIIFKWWKYNHYFIILVVLFESSIQQSLKTKDYKEHPSHSMYLKLKNHLKKNKQIYLAWARRFFGFNKAEYFCISSFYRAIGLPLVQYTSFSSCFFFSSSSFSSCFFFSSSIPL